ncbi:DUF456 domain-containing protein, partial [[Kitasatospora] papulosa]
PHWRVGGARRGPTGWCVGGGVGGGLGGSAGAFYGAERLRLGSRAAGWTSLRSVLRATGYSVLVELYCCLLAVGAWLGAVIWG